MGGTCQGSCELTLEVDIYDADGTLAGKSGSKTYGLCFKNVAHYKVEFSKACQDLKNTEAHRNPAFRSGFFQP